MHITMVKKRLASGEACPKCLQAEEVLRGRGLWARIDEVVWAEEGRPESPGMVLAARHGVELAPFFVVRADDGTETVHVSTIRLIKLALQQAATPLSGAPVEGLDGEGLVRAEAELAVAEPIEVVRWALERFGADCAIAFSGAEDVVLVDLAVRTGLPFGVFCLDTGRLHPETYRYLETVRTHYGIALEVLSPEPAAVQDLVRRKGLFSFLEDGHGECCGVRKVAPLKAHLAGQRAWMTGQRRDQSPTRAEVPVVQADPAFRGRGDGPLVKLNPLANWTSEQVWAYIRGREVPFNPLHTRGFKSIGCEPCTRATHPGEHEREGRWWWEEATVRECGLHVAKAAPATAEPT